MDPIRAYDRTVNRLTRREVLKIAGAAGLAALGRPVVSAQTIERPIFGRTRLRSASRPAIRCRTASFSGRGSRRIRSTAAACR